MSRVNNNGKKRFLLKFLLFIITIVLVIGGVFIYSIYSSLIDNSIPIVERPDDYTVDYTPPDDIVEIVDNPSDEQNDPEQSAGENGTDEDLNVDTDENNYVYKSSIKQTPIYKKDRINEDVLNILLLGSDSRDPKTDRGRTDSIMVLSYNKSANTATLLSLQRDSLIPIEDNGWNRINTTYFYGGIGLSINTINDLFDLDIQYYAIINFDGFQNVVDKIGGVDVNLTEEEADYYNRTHGWDLTEGLNTLNGQQALVHSRNRTTGSEYDFGRTRRQREVLMSIFNKCINSMDFSTITSLIEFGMTKVSTNLPPDLIYSTATNVLSGETPEIITSYMPFEDTWTSVWYNKMSVLQIDIKENRRLIHELLY